MDKEREVHNVRVSKMNMQSVRLLIMWINETLETNVQQMTELSTGAVYCQLMHSIFRRSINLSKVYFYTNDQWQYASNYKLLKKSFIKMDLSKEIPERQLQQGRGHFDFANWFYMFYHANKPNEPYDAMTARKGALIGIRDKNSSPKIFDRCRTLLDKPPKTAVDQSLRTRSLVNVATVTPNPVRPKMLVKEIQPRQKSMRRTKEYYDESRPISLLQYDSDDDRNETNLEKTDQKTRKHTANMLTKCECIKQIALKDSNEPLNAMLKINSIAFAVPGVASNQLTTSKWLNIQKIMLEFSESAGQAMCQINNIISNS